MKKLNTIVLALIFAVAAAIPTFADTTIKSVIFKIDTPNYVVNGQTPGNKMDVSPFLQNDRTYVPVRFLGNALGLTDDNITWDQSTQTVTLKGASATLQMIIGQASITSNGQARTIDIAPVLTQDRTFLPARYVAEGLGYQVAWDDKNQVVICWTQGQQQPNVSGAVNWLNGQSQQPVNLVNPPVQQPTANGTWRDITGNGGFYAPWGVAVDSSGNVYVVDTGYNKIKKLVNGIWTDITGNGSFNWPHGVAVDSSGDVYVADTNNNKIKKLASGTWTDITGNGGFWRPEGIAVDSSGNIYVADTNNSKIKKLANGTWTDITGNGDFGKPEGVAVESSGNAYMADSGHSKIKKLANGIWTDITGNGGIKFPYGVVVDNSGNVYVADTGNCKIKKLANGIWTDITGDGGFKGPWGVAVDSYGNVYVTDVTGKVKKLSR